MEIEARAASIGSSNYYEILNVDRTAPTTAIQAAFFHLAKKWHPDRLPAALGPAKEAATRIFSRMSEAHQVLTNDEQRVEYERLMREGGAAPDEQEMVQRVLRAATAFQKAEVLARRSNYEEAEKLAALAVESDPDQAEYLALHADLLSMRPERATLGYADLVKMVNQAKRKQPDNMKVRLYRARVLKRAGELELAHREYRNIVEHDAQNVEAAREVRLFQMRKGKGSTDPKRSGEHRLSVTKKSEAPKSPTPSDIGQLFGKFFKR
jgi:tetratricopeptide (TPR) repeat protein